MCFLKEKRVPNPPRLLGGEDLFHKEDAISVSPATSIAGLLSKRNLLHEAEFPPSKFHKPNEPPSKSLSIIETARSGNLEQFVNEVHHCDVNEQDPIMGNTPLHFAIFNNHLAIIKQLLQRQDIDLDKANKLGMTPLLAAVESGHSAIVRMLVSANADVQRSDMQGFTCLHKAILTGNLEILRALLNSKNAPLILNTPSLEQKLTPLHQAAFHGKTDSLKLLLNANAEVNPKTSAGLTPLHMASLKNHYKVIKHLLRHGAGIDELDCSRRTPLHYACIYGHLDAASILLESNCSKDFMDAKNQTPLQIAAAGHLNDLVRLLSN